MTTVRIKPFAERREERVEQLAKRGVYGDLHSPEFLSWAADVDLALTSLGQACDELRVRMQGRTPVIVPTSAPLAARFVDNGDGTVSDNKTGLMWQAGPGAKLDWKLANSFCREKYLGGHIDWRLPSIEELCSIVDYERHDPACDPVFGALSVYYWSSSTYVGDPQLAWYVNFSYGYVNAGYKTDHYYARAVRGGKP